MLRQHRTRVVVGVATTDQSALPMIVPSWCNTPSKSRLPPVPLPVTLSNAAEYIKPVRNLLGCVC